MTTKDENDDGIVLPGDNTVTEPVFVDEAPDQPPPNPADTADPSPATGDNQETKTHGMNDRFNKITAEKYAAVRRADNAEQALKVAQEAANTAPVTVSAVEKPVLPDDLDDRAAMEAYHAEMLSYSEQTAAASATKVFNDSRQADQDTAHKAKENKVISAYEEKAIADGVDMVKLNAGEKMLNDNGVSAQLGTYIMQDKFGGKIVEYLHDNVAEMHELLALDPVSAGVMIETVIKQKALANTPNLSNTPDPLPDIGGTGALTKDAFEKEFPNTVFI
ncbi:MAG: hypothetical protein V3V40_06285 [Nitrosomonadaceae bacterium]